MWHTPVKKAVSVRKSFLKFVDIKNNGIFKMIFHKSYLLKVSSMKINILIYLKKFLCFLMMYMWQIYTKNSSGDFQHVLWEWVTYILYDRLLTMNHNLELQKHNFTLHLLQTFLTIKWYWPSFKQIQQQLLETCHEKRAIKSP